MSRTQSVAEAATTWRQRIHAHPELGFEEEATSALVAELLSDFGFDVHSGIGGTGVVGVLRRGTSSAAIGLRADMDALPIDETGTVPHKSTRAGTDYWIELVEQQLPSNPESIHTETAGI